jgi:TRAP-type uncharacterized transport system fused permease subunit
MDLEWIGSCWREQTNAVPAQLEKETVMRMLVNRTTDLRRQVRRRLRREASYYLPLMAVLAASVVGSFTLTRVLAAASVVLMIGAVIATLRWAERSIDDVPLDRSVREALTDLQTTLDHAARAYVTVYVAVFAISSMILLAVVWRRDGAGPLLAVSVTAAALAVAWAYRSGQGYVERMFRRYRVDLSDCLGQLDDL